MANSVETSTIRELQVLSQGRGVEQVTGLSYDRVATGEPESSLSGVDLTKIKPVLGLIGVILSPRPGRTDVVIEVTTATFGNAYTVTFDGTNYTYTALAGDSISDVAQGIKDAIGAQAKASIEVTSSLFEGNLRVYVVFKAIAGQAAYTVATSSPGLVAGNMASSVDYRIWGYLEDIDTWALIPDTTRTAVFTEFERYTVSGISRVYVEIIATDGYCAPLILPAGSSNG